MRRVIFLDIDGVLATPESIGPSGFWTFTPRCVDQLRRILSACPDAEIVISSSWRKDTIEATKQHLKDEGLGADIVDRITGITIRGYNYIHKGVAMSIPRGVEIKQWIDHNIHSGGNGMYIPGKNGTFRRKRIGYDYAYVILDDDTGMLLEQANRFVRCSSAKGLTRELADKAIALLRSRDIHHSEP